MRIETVEYQGYEIRALEWLGQWQASVVPMSLNLPRPPEQQVVAASLEVVLDRAHRLVNRLNPPAKSWAEILKSS